MTLDEAEKRRKELLKRRMGEPLTPEEEAEYQRLFAAQLASVEAHIIREHILKKPPRNRKRK